MHPDLKFRLSELIAKAIAEYLDGNDSYPFAILRMPLAEYIVDELEQHFDNAGVQSSQAS